MKVALIGLGEVGRCYTRAMIAAGIEFVGASETFLSPATQQLINEAGITVCSGCGEWLGKADIVLSAVTGGAALAAARAAFPFMRPGAIYADFTTASPVDMRTAAAEAQALGLRFVDVAIMGGITLSGAKTPLLCAGAGAASLGEALAPLHAEIRVLADGEPGDAVTLKLLRSIFMKGLEALAVETLTLAESAGLKAKLYENLADFDKAPLPEFLDMLVRTHVLHAARRFHEVESAEAQLETAGFEHRVTTGVKSLFDRSCQAVDGLSLSPDISVAEALGILIRSARVAPASTITA
ncbi:MAG: NAD(P)-binding domain-containing protein [Rhodospirillaceae bacterium]|nr:NAD(P)-binding domain-containing protein [Rhodospirillaceae bacterium]